MPRDHIILRARRPVGTAGPFGQLEAWPSLGMLQPATVHAPAEIDVAIEVAALSDGDVLDAASDPTVAAITPVMPTRLIAPEPSTAAVTTGPTWGIAAVEADQSLFDGAGVTVAILDTGIDANHAAFAGVTLQEQDFTGTGNGDSNGHGSHCAGTVFGRDVAGTRIGVARGVTHALIGKVISGTGRGSTDTIQNAILWASEQGAHVISMSIGIDFPGAVNDLVSAGWPVGAATSRALRDYAATLRAFDALVTLVRARSVYVHGPVLVAASGNESARLGTPSYTIAAALPSETRDVVAVGALGQLPNGFQIAPFSNTFPQVVGPGVDVVSVKAGSTTGLVALSGTSMATPHVAGIAALWWQKLGATASAAVATNRLVGSASMSGFTTLPSMADVGSGLVKAPR